MGNYFDDFYGDKYAVIGIPVREGNIATRRNDSNDMITSNINFPIDGSFEKTCINAGKGTFYYPTYRLKNETYAIRHIGNKITIFQSPFHHNLMKINSNGFIFLPMSKAIKNDNQYDENYGWNKFINRNKYLKSIKQ